MILKLGDYMDLVNHDAFVLSKKELNKVGDMAGELDKGKPTKPGMSWCCASCSTHYSTLQ